MDCEICGRDDDLKLVTLRGTRMMVCSKCNKYGVDVPQTYLPNVKKTVAFEGDEDSFEFAENYSKLIQKARQQKGLKRKELAMKINESESYISKVEAGKIKPTEKVVKKLEKFLGIKIHSE